jgi:hypothetical protein
MEKHPECRKKINYPIRLLMVNKHSTFKNEIEH